MLDETVVAADDVLAMVARIRQPVRLVRPDSGGDGTLPPVYPEWLGDRSFTDTHGVRFPYVAGEMANGIATTRMVAAMARADMLGFYGAAGLDPAVVERAVHELGGELGDRASWGV